MYVDGITHFLKGLKNLKEHFTFLVVSFVFKHDLENSVDLLFTLKFSKPPPLFEKQVRVLKKKVNSTILLNCFAN